MMSLQVSKKCSDMHCGIFPLPFKAITATLSITGGKDTVLFQQVYFEYTYKDHWDGNASTAL